MRRIPMLSLCLLFVAFGACKTSSTTQSQANTSSGTSETSTAQSSPGQITSTGSPSAAQTANAVKPKVDACAMLDSKEIQAVQGEPVKETKLSGQAGGGLLISQCFFTLPTFSNSISLLVAQKGDGPDAKAPSEFWRETFQKGSAEKDREREREREKKDGDKDKNAGGRREEEEEEITPPQKVTGVGDEAFWIGSRVGGALYVLKGNAYLRISIGGSGDQTNRIAKSKTLAQKVISRLK
jgi:hypothetical protein